MSLPWHPRNHQDALDGMLMLTLEERGAYNTILDLIYQRAGPIPDDERWLSGWMGCSVKKWRLLRASLLVKGKITECDHNGKPGLMNDRARQELDSASTRRRVAAESGASGGRKSAQNRTKSNEINADSVPPVEGSLKLLTLTSTGTDKGLEASLPAATAVATDGASSKLKTGKPKPWLTDPDFTAAWDACSPDMRRRSLGRDATYGHWQRQALLAGGGEALRAAHAAYMQGDPDVKRTGGPGFHLWLKDGTWDHWMAGGSASAAVVDLGAWEARKAKNAALYEEIR